MTILMFDKDKDAIGTFQFFAESNNYQLLHTINIKEALTWCEQKDVDVVLVDMLIHEQGLDKEPLGFVFFKALRENSKIKDILVIILSGMSTLENHQKAKNLKAADFIHKNTRPFEELLKRIKEIVAEYQKKKK